MSCRETPGNHMAFISVKPTVAFKNETNELNQSEDSEYLHGLNITVQKLLTYAFIWVFRLKCCGLGRGMTVVENCLKT